MDKENEKRKKCRGSFNYTCNIFVSLAQRRSYEYSCKLNWYTFKHDEIHQNKTIQKLKELKGKSYKTGYYKGLSTYVTKYRLQNKI